MFNGIKFQVNVDLKNWSTIWSEENTFWGRIVWHFRKQSYFLKLEQKTNKQKTHSKLQGKKTLRYNDTFIKLSFNKACLMKHHGAGRSVDSSLTKPGINPYSHGNLLPCLQFQNTISREREMASCGRPSSCSWTSQGSKLIDISITIVLCLYQIPLMTAWHCLVKNFFLCLFMSFFTSFLTPRWITYAAVTNMSHLKNHKTAGQPNII